MHNRYRYATRGNDPQGWAWSPATSPATGVLRADYTDKNQAIASIVASIAHKEPVGVTVYRGTHAWVVLGYRTSPRPDRADQEDAPRAVRERPARDTPGQVAVRVT